MKVGGAIFGGIFFLAGLGVFFFFVLSTVFDAIQMQSWQAVPAELKKAEISSYQSRNDNGSYTTMYSLDLVYEYNAGGRTYYGDRADIVGGSSSNSDEHYQRKSKITNEADRNQLRVWVDPNNPADSVYDRSVKPKLLVIMTLFSGVFMLIGGGIILVSRKKEAELPPGVIPNPAKPWTTRAEWASSTIFSNAQSKLGIIKFFAILSVLVFGMISLAMVGEHPVATGFAIAFVLPPVLLFRWYKKKKQEWEHFQKVPVQLNPYPGLVGGKVAGNILVPGNYTAGDKYTFELKCTHHWTTRSGNETKHHSSVIWSDKITPTPKAKVNGTYLTFDFDVPADKPQSSIPDNNYHKWTLEIKSDLKDINFNRDYDLPVFVTEESQTVEDELAAQPLTAQEKAEMHSRLSINQPKEVNTTVSTSTTKATPTSTSKDELTLHTPGDKTGWFFAGIGFLFFCIGLGIAIIGGSTFGYAFATIATVFMAIGILIVGRNCRIRVTPNQITVDVFIFSQYVKQHNLTLDNINEIKAVQSTSTSTNGKQSYVRYGLKVLTRYGKDIDLGGEFKSMKNATHMKQKIEAILFNE